MFKCQTFRGVTRGLPQAIRMTRRESNTDIWLYFPFTFYPEVDSTFTFVHDSCSNNCTKSDFSMKFLRERPWHCPMNFIYSCGLLLRLLFSSWWSQLEVYWCSFHSAKQIVWTAFIRLKYIDRPNQIGDLGVKRQVSVLHARLDQRMKGSCFNHLAFPYTSCNRVKRRVFAESGCSLGLHYEYRRQNRCLQRLLVFKWTEGAL